MTGVRCGACGGAGVLDHGDRPDPDIGLVADVLTCTDCDGHGRLVLAGVTA